MKTLFSPFRVGAKLLLTALALPIGIFAQGPNTNINPPPQIQNVNYINLIDENNNSLGNASGKINDDINPIQTNIAIQQQANPPAQVQQQSSGSIFGSEDNNQSKTTGCNDCDAVKQAIKASHASSGGNYHKKSFGMKRWSRTFSGKMNMKMKKMFTKKYKAKTSYALCFNWH
ncbi:MAG: hypothetical protein HY841_09190 [Bacteroidetes bacterium]|nr:hypothetical protein [Bacteroidota bacterium]